MKGALGQTCLVVGLVVNIIAIGAVLYPMDLFSGPMYEKADIWNLDDWEMDPGTERISIIGYWHPDMPPSNVEFTSIEIYVKPLSFREGEPPGWTHIRVFMTCRTYDIPPDGIRDGYFRGRVEMVEFNDPYPKWVTIPLDPDYGRAAGNWSSCHVNVDFDAPGPYGPNAAYLGWGYEDYRQYFLKLHGRQYELGEEPDPDPDPDPSPDPLYPDPPPVDPTDESLTPPPPPKAVDTTLIAVIIVFGIILILIAIMLFLVMR